MARQFHSRSSFSGRARPGTITPFTRMTTISCIFIVPCAVKCPECVKRMNLRKVSDKPACLLSTGRGGVVGSGAVCSAAAVSFRCRILCGLNGLLGIRGLSIASTLCPCFLDGLGLSAALSALGGYSCGPQPISPLSDFSRSLFRFRRTATARLFGSSVLAGCGVSPGLPGVFGRFRLSTSARAFCLFSAISLADFVKGHNHIAGLRVW